MSHLDDEEFAMKAPYIQKVLELEQQLTARDLTIAEKDKEIAELKISEKRLHRTEHDFSIRSESTKGLRNEAG